MKLNIIKGDLFQSNSQCLAHCVSADFALGAGIAVAFAKNFDMKNKLKAQDRNKVGDAVLIESNGIKVFNLITKEKYFQKPTMNTLNNTLKNMKEQIVEQGINEISMPAIGCGLDKLNFNLVKRSIEVIFKDLDITINIYQL